MPAYVFGQVPVDRRFIPPAVHVVVEADGPDEANELVLRTGVYFDGHLMRGEDGDRWWRIDECADEFESVEDAIDCIKGEERRNPEGVAQAGAAFIVVRKERP